MWDFIKQSWDQGVDIATLGLLAISIVVNAGLLTRRSKTLKDLLYIEQERDNFRKKHAEAKARLEYVDPERFIDRAMDLRQKGDWDALEKAAFDFSDKQSDAFGLAAEILTEQRILDSEEHGKSAIEDAQRFAAIGRAANPDSARLHELAKLAERRARDIAAGEPIETLNWDGLSDTELNRLSLLLAKDAKYALAEIAARRSVPLALLRTGEVSANYAGALGQHADTLRQLGSYAEAETIHEKALEIDRATFGKGHPEYAGRLSSLSVVVHAQGRYEEAEGLVREALEIDRATLGEGHPSYAAHLNNLAGVVQAQGRYAEAEGLYREALEIGRATIGEGHPEYATRLNNLASVVQAQGRVAEAEGLFREALEIGRATIGEAHPEYAIRLGNLGRLMGETGRTEEGRAMLERTLAIFRETLPADHPDLAEAQRRLAALPAD